MGYHSNEKFLNRSELMFLKYAQLIFVCAAHASLTM